MLPVESTVPVPPPLRHTCVSTATPRAPGPRERSDEMTTINTCHQDTPAFQNPVLLGKRALTKAYPERAQAERLTRQGDAAPGVLPPPQATLARLPAPMLVRCSGAKQVAWPADTPALCDAQLQYFCNGDPFVEVQAPLRHRPVAVLQGVGDDASGTCAKVVEALYALWAARAAQSQEHMVLVLPEALDPHLHPTLFNRLLIKLAKASGAREIQYAGPAAADSAPASTHATPAAASAMPPATAAFLTLLAQQLAQTSTFEGAQAVYAMAHGHAKLAGRRGMPLIEAPFVALARQAIRQGGACAPTSARGYVVFGSTANPQLQQSVAQALGERGPSKVGKHTFGASAMPEVMLQTQVASQHVVICDSLRPAPGPGVQEPYLQGPARTLEALMLAQAAREAGARQVTIVQAYQMNGRSDRAEHTLDGTHAGAYCDLVARWFDAAKCDGQVLVECHDLHTPTYWSSSKHAHAGVVDGIALLVQDALVGVPKSRAILALPDAGSAKRAKHLRVCFDRTFEGQKIRTAHGAAPELVDGGVGGIDPQSVVVLPDDETASGKTLVMALKNLRQHGAQTIHVALVHNNLTLDPIERNLRLAMICDAGATTLRVGDTHAMGHVVNSYEELLAQSADPVATAEQVRDFCDKEHIATAPQALFSGLAQKLRKVSMAPAIAAAIQPLHQGRLVFSTQA